MKQEEVLEIKDILKIYLQELDGRVKIDTELDVNELFKKIFKLENKFSSTLRSFKGGRDVYRKFCHYILVEVSDLREARTFFRERQSSFLLKVNKAFSRANMREIYKIKINYSFCVFAMSKLEEDVDGKKNKLQELMQEMKVIRNQIIENYLYLALHRAKIFYGKNHYSGLEFSDFIQASNYGLVTSVDKFVPEDNKYKFHHVAQGLMISNLLTMQTEHYSAATLGTHGQKKLASLRKTLNTMNGNANIPELAKILQIAEDDIADLMNATKHLSMNATSSQDSDSMIGDTVDFEDAEKMTPEEEAEDSELKMSMMKFYRTLDLIEKKILLLKGVINYEDYERLNSSEAV
jgi:DNA-directed RNA polymerase sigma subunit (sigma70/sigma32)